MNASRRGLFYTAAFLLLAFECALVYFIMPMPGSQETNSLDLAYFLHTNRMVFRAVFVALLLWGFLRGMWKKRWLPYAVSLVLLAAIYIFNFQMSADHMFRQPRQLIMVSGQENKVDLDRLVIGLEQNGQAKAYPIRFLGYHHQVQDSIAGKPVLVTYCTVCRSGRAWDPHVDGQHETFRLVGMDHFNAMIEDKSSGSWWRQATGEAVTGPRKGMKLEEVFSMQTSLREWISLYPHTLVMQEDPAYRDKYDTTRKYESGKSKSKLTGTDTLSWKRKSWVIGVNRNGAYRAYDWNKLVHQRIIEDTLGGAPVFIVVSKDSTSFFAFDQTLRQSTPIIQADTIVLAGKHYRLNGQGIDTSGRLHQLPAYQEFWHSWEYFHPSTNSFDAKQ